MQLEKLWILEWFTVGGTYTRLLPVGEQLELTIPSKMIGLLAKIDKDEFGFFDISSLLVPAFLRIIYSLQKAVHVFDILTNVLSSMDIANIVLVWSFLESSYFIPIDGKTY